MLLLVLLLIMLMASIVLALRLPLLAVGAIVVVVLSFLKRRVSYRVHLSTLVGDAFLDTQFRS